MAIVGIQQIRYGVTDLAESVRFFEDFGLRLHESSPDRALFVLGNGASVELLELGDSRLPVSKISSPGVQEVVWGVDSELSLDRLVQDLAKDHSIESPAPGHHRFTPFFGIPMSLVQWTPLRPAAAPDPVNAPGLVRRLNNHRKWRRRANPKMINHVVFRTPHYAEATTFMRERMGFRLSDIQKGFGIYMRADGSNHHHHLLFLNANAPLPGCDGTTSFDHANFGVEDIDELMVGVNHLLRRGWPGSAIGLGRHRVDSALFYYVPCPAGGEAEYGTDSDYIDDSWIPRHFHVPLFAYAHWTHQIPHFLEIEPEWAFDYLTEEEMRSGVPLERGV